MNVTSEKVSPMTSSLQCAPSMQTKQYQDKHYRNSANHILPTLANLRGISKKIQIITINAQPSPGCYLIILLDSLCQERSGQIVFWKPPCANICDTRTAWAGDIPLRGMFADLLRKYIN